MTTSSRERTAFGLRLYEARKAAKLTQVNVRAALGISQGLLSDLERGGERSAYVPALAQLYGCDPYYLATGEQPPKRGVDGGVTGSRFEPQAFDDRLLTREQIMSMGELPARFVFALEDDAMGDFGRAGTQVVFESAREARPGAGVLVRDRDGQLSVRRKAQGRSQAHWLAVAPNGVYRSLDSEADGLELLAVWRGVVNRGLEDQ